MREAILYYLRKYTIHRTHGLGANENVENYSDAYTTLQNEKCTWALTQMCILSPSCAPSLSSNGNFQNSNKFFIFQQNFTIECCLLL